MTTFNTGNPIGSTAVKDLYDNAENFDRAVNGNPLSWKDRLGNTRKSWSSIENSIEDVRANANAIIASLGYQVPVPYAAGIEMTLANQTVSYDGDTYAPIANELPFATSGTFEADKFRLIRGVSGADLAAPYGAALVGFKQAGAGAVPRTAQDKMRDTVSVKDFGAVGDGEDDTMAIQLALNSGGNPTIAKHLTTSALSISLDSQRVSGFGPSTKLLRKGTGAFINTGNTDGVCIESLTVDMGAGGPGGHGVRSVGDDLTIDRVSIENLAFPPGGGGGGAGVINFSSAGSGLGSVFRPRLSNITISADATQTHASLFGWILGDAHYGFVSNVLATDIKATDIAYAHELKDDARWNNLSSLTAVNSNVALAYGQQTEGVNGAKNNSAVGILADACDTGVLIGEGRGNVISAVVHNDTGGPGIEPKATVHLSGSAERNAAFGVLSMGSSASTAVMYGSGSKNNYAQVACMGNNSGTMVSFAGLGTARNFTEIAHPGGRDTIKPHIVNSNSSPIGGTGSNPVHCPATGERIGTLSGYFYDQQGDSGITTWAAGHRWRYEYTSAVIHAYGTRGQNGDAVGFVHTTPDATNRGSVLHVTGVTENDDVLAINGFGLGSAYRFTRDGFVPAADGARKLGSASLRWSQVYAASGTINTSDEREKQKVEPIDDAALRAWAKVGYCQFKFNDAVAAKGDGARWHFGLIAQRVKDAFESEGLDAFEYGLLCYDEWEELPEILDEEGNVTQEHRPAGSRYGIRYEEALALECAYLRSRIDSVPAT